MTCLKTNGANFHFRSVCFKLVALRVNLYQEVALSFRKFADPCFKRSPTPDMQLLHFLHHPPKLEIRVEMLQFLLKLLLNLRFLAVHHHFY